MSYDSAFKISLLCSTLEPFSFVKFDDSGSAIDP